MNMWKLLLTGVLAGLIGFVFEALMGLARKHGWSEWRILGIRLIVALALSVRLLAGNDKATAIALGIMWGVMVVLLVVGICVRLKSTRHKDGCFRGVK